MGGASDGMRREEVEGKLQLYCIGGGQASCPASPQGWLDRCSPTVVNDWRERFVACNGKAVRELDAHVARMTRTDDMQKRATDSLRDGRKAAGFRQH